MPRKGENIYKRKDGRWEGRYIKSRTPTGKAQYGYVYAHSYYDVKKKLLQAIQIAYSTEQKVSVSDGMLEAISFKSIAEAWLENIKPQVKHSTYVKYLNSLNNYILPHYGHVAPWEVTYASLESFASQLLSSGSLQKTGLSSKTVSDVITIIREILGYARRHGHQVDNIGSGLVVKQPNQNLTILTKAEQIQLQEYLMAHMNYQNLGLLICLFTGIRVGELCALRWEDISLAEKQIHIHATMQRLQCEPGSLTKTSILITEPKSRCSIRKIPVPDRVIEVICKHFSGQTGYLLTGIDNKFIEPRAMQYHFKKVLRESQIREVNFHALRHTFATRCVECGFDIKTLSEILGHSSVNITMNRYVHPTMDYKRENMNRLSELLSVK